MQDESEGKQGEMKYILLCKKNNIGSFFNPAQ